MEGFKRANIMLPNGTRSIIFIKKNKLNKSFKVKPPYHKSKNPTIENEIWHCTNVPLIE